MTQFFISYSSEDGDAAELIKEKLQNYPITVWQDRNGGINVGDQWRDKIESGIRGSDAILIVLTPNACASPYVTFEWAYGLGLGKLIIPLLWHDCKKHPRLETFQHLDLRSPRNWELLNPEKLLQDRTSQPDTASIEGIWADTFKIHGEPRVSLLAINRLDDRYSVQGYEYDSELNIRYQWDSEFSRYDPKKRKLEYYYIATKTKDLSKVRGFTDISFSTNTNGAATAFTASFMDFIPARAKFIKKGRLVAGRSMFGDVKGKMQLVKALLDEEINA
jgi:hypothetical protein